MARNSELSSLLPIHVRAWCLHIRVFRLIEFSTVGEVSSGVPFELGLNGVGEWIVPRWRRLEHQVFRSPAF
jgi:hypothetical protein